MTWDEFVAKVEQSFKDENIPRDVPIGQVSWDKDLFGGPTPGVYVQRNEDGSLLIGED